MDSSKPKATAGERTEQDTPSLSDAELEAVAGGMSTYWQCGKTVIVISADATSAQLYIITAKQLGIDDLAGLLDARAALAGMAPAAKPSPPPAFSREAVLAVVDNLASAVLAKPQKGKALLRQVVDGILMEPSPDGYAVRVTLKKTNPAALGEDSGVGDYQSGCGGRI